MVITQLDGLRNDLKSLRVRHCELDNEISMLTEQSYVNSLALQRLKKQKLSLKDAIVKLESKLIPDINA